MVNSRLKWHCPYCSQTSSRHGNLKVHIKRKHQGIGEPIREDKWHYTRATTSTPAHFIPDIMSWQSNNNYHLNQRYPQTFSSTSPSFKKEQDTSKKKRCTR
jgi:hypothetical protein